MLSRATGFLFAFRLCLTFLWFQSEPARGSAAAILCSLALLLASLSYRLLTSPHSLVRQNYPTTVKWIGLYLLLALCSLLWTTVPSVAVAGAYWFGMTSDVGTVLILLQCQHMKAGLSIMQGFVVGAVVVAKTAWSVSPTMDLRLGNEDFLHPNAVGFELAIAALMAIYLGRVHKGWSWIAAGLATTLLRTLSKASIAAFIVASLFYFFRTSDLSRKAKLVLGLGCAAVVGFFWTVLEAYADMYAQGRNLETLTGRTLIWATSLEIALEKPWLGHGFYSFRWVVPLFGDFEAWQAHNELLQQFFAYGILGVGIVLTLYWHFYRQIRFTYDCQLASLSLALLIFALVRGLVDAERFGLCLPLWLIALLSLSMSHIATSNLS